MAKASGQHTLALCLVDLSDSVVYGYFLFCWPPILPFSVALEALLHPRSGSPEGRSGRTRTRIVQSSEIVSVWRKWRHMCVWKLYPIPFRLSPVVTGWGDQRYSVKQCPSTHCSLSHPVIWPGMRRSVKLWSDFAVPLHRIPLPAEVNGNLSPWTRWIFEPRRSNFSRNWTAPRSTNSITEDCISRSTRITETKWKHICFLLFGWNPLVNGTPLCKGLLEDFATVCLEKVGVVCLWRTSWLLY